LLDLPVYSDELLLLWWQIDNEATENRVGIPSKNGGNVRRKVFQYLFKCEILECINLVFPDRLVEDCKTHDMVLRKLIELVCARVVEILTNLGLLAAVQC
jgi:hypothetical protein